jgi:hypothetical protein
MRHLSQLIFVLLIIPSIKVNAQLDMLDDNDFEDIQNYTIATFKTNRVINGHNMEMVAKNEFDFKISHRFGYLNTGAYEFFGLDQANIRMGGDFGLTENLNIGIGRSSFEKTYDGFVKYRFLRQQTGKRNIPITAAVITHTGINTLRWRDTSRENYFSSRLHYTHQLLIARKFTDGLSVQLSPTLVHKNLVDSASFSNDIWALGVGIRQKLTTRTTLNLEYFQVLTNRMPYGNTNALSIGFDIETGGHVFQLFFTNAMAPFEKGFITDTNGQWLKGDVRIGFNIARIFDFSKS